jgi:hypothetical protein
MGHDGSVLVVLRYQATGLPDGSTDLADPLDAALSVLSQRPGFLRGWVGRSPDDLSQWLLAAEWVDVGSMRRGLGAFDAKVALGPLQPYASPASGAWEVLTSVDRSRRSRHPSGRAADADSAHPD